jgi:hypothetical protein
MWDNQLTTKNRRFEGGAFILSVFFSPCIGDPRLGGHGCGGRVWPYRNEVGGGSDRRNRKK